MLKIIVHGFLSGLGFLLAVAAVALVLHNPVLAFIPVALLSAYWHRRHGGDVKRAIAAIRAFRGQRRD
jgi:glucose-6-phosphate-specific signal transduction histidine kinase